MPLIDFPQSSPQVFYSLAATLIPIFLFGGTFVAQLSRPPKAASHSSLLWRAALIPLFGAVAITAEAMAINAAVAGDASGFERAVIVFALISGLTVTIMGIWLPWIARIRSARIPKPVKWLVLGGPALFLLLSAYSVLSQMNRTITYAGEAENQVALRIAINQRAAELRDADRRIDVYIYRLGRLRERLMVAIERDEPHVRRAVVIEIETQEKLEEIQRRHLYEIARKGWREIAEAKPEF
jgi:hypothetical protein